MYSNLQTLVDFGRKFEEVTIRGIYTQVFLALRYIHSFGFLHADVKPNNILIDYQGGIKLGDFGESIRMGIVSVFSFLLL